jgi:hypothetical protein
MNMIIDYKLLQADGNRELQKEVKRFIDQGWEPFGAPIHIGLQSVLYPDQEERTVVWTFAQAIVKRQPESEELGGLRARMTATSEQVSAGLTGVISEREALEGIARLFVANSGPVQVQPGYAHQYDQDPRGKQP